MVNFLTLNINGLRDQVKREALLLWFSSMAPSLDIICIQETHSTSDAELLSWFNGSPYSCIGSHLSNHSAGVCILFKPCFVLSHFECHHSGRFVVADFTSCYHEFRVLCVYAPNQYLVRRGFFEDLFCFSNVAIPVFLLGDFNSVFDRALDRSSSHIDFAARDTSDKLGDLFLEFNVIDIWRSLHLVSKSFTWTRPDGTMSSRIDLVGVPSIWSCFAVCSTILPCPHSDHCAVSLLYKYSLSSGKGP